MASNDRTNSNNLSEFSPLVRHWGATAARPAADLVTGQSYLDTDLGQWVYYTGSVFAPIGAGSGTSFPASPATDQRYFRTDRGLEYFWDGTRWLTTQNWPVALSVKPGVTTPLSVSTNAVNQGAHPDGSSDIYIVNIVTTLFALGTNNTLNYWTVNFVTRTSTIATSHTYTANTASSSSGVILPINVAVNGVVTRSDFYDIVQNMVTTGSPGTINFFPAIANCRLIG